VSRNGAMFVTSRVGDRVTYRDNDNSLRKARTRSTMRAPRCYAGGGGGRGDAQALSQVFSSDLEAVKAVLSLLRCAAAVTSLLYGDFRSNADIDCVAVCMQEYRLRSCTARHPSG